jgi:hypothetical protein
MLRRGWHLIGAVGARFARERNGDQETIRSFVFELMILSRIPFRLGAGAARGHPAAWEWEQRKYGPDFSGPWLT